MNTAKLWGQDDPRFWLFILCAWIMFLPLCILVWLTHPGCCAWIVKKVITGEWKNPSVPKPPETPGTN